jgi:peptidyl-prolyl cis-trans isomerase C
MSSLPSYPVKIMRRYSQIVVIVLVATATMWSQQVTRTSLASSRVVARVNGTPILQRDLDLQMRSLFPFYSVHGGQVPASAQTEIRQKAMDKVLLEELLYQEARRRGLTVTAAEVNARIANARNKATSRAEFEDAIVETYGSMSSFKDRATHAMLVEKLWAQQITTPAHTTDAELLKFYRDNKKKFERPDAVELQTISFLFRANGTAAQQEQARKKADAILEKAQATKTVDEFGALAEKNSEDDWRVMNGDHGWVHRGTLEDDLVSAFAMKPGKVSGVVPSRVGYHILRVNGYRAATQMTFAEVKKDLRKKIERERQEKLRSVLEARLRSKARIEYQ